jgi:hypothetical protein
MAELSAEVTSHSVLSAWRNGLRICHVGHSASAAYFTRLHRLLGVPVVVASTIVGTTVFSSLGDAPPVFMMITAGVLSVVSGILAGLQTFLDYSGLAQRHHTAAARYGTLRRELDTYMSQLSVANEQASAFMERFRREWDQVERESPPIQRRFHDDAIRHIRDLATDPLPSNLRV